MSAEVEVTDEMLRAGADLLVASGYMEYGCMPWDAGIHDLVREIYCVMALISRGSEPQEISDLLRDRLPWQLWYLSHLVPCPETDAGS